MFSSSDSWCSAVLGAKECFLAKMQWQLAAHLVVDTRQQERRSGRTRVNEDACGPATSRLDEYGSSLFFRPSYSSRDRRSTSHLDCSGGCIPSMRGDPTRRSAEFGACNTL